MRLDHVPQLLRLARGARAYLGRPLTRERATRDLIEQLARREERFLEAARLLIYDHPSSPYLALLREARCELGDLQRRVREDGVESALASLRAQGVHVTLDELKGRAPIRRSGLELAVAEEDFDNPLRLVSGIRGRTGGSRGRPTGVTYDWAFLEEEAYGELLLQEIHGVARVPLALWYLGPPAMAGLHNLLLDVKLGRPPERWFSQLREASVPASMVDRLAVRGLRLALAASGRRAPAVEAGEIEDPAPVLDWVAAGAPRLLKTYASSAVQLALAARARGLDLSGTVIFCGGEPLTRSRRQAVEAAGATAVPRYIATESGLLAAGCGRGSSPDGMHVYLNRLAVITDGAAPDGLPDEASPLLWTSLSRHAPKVLLNADLGDAGCLRRRSCECAFGALGLDQEVAHVRGHAKLSIRGMTVVEGELDDIVGDLVRGAGGGPEDYQFWQVEELAGVAKLVIAVSPHLEDVDADGLARTILARLAARAAGGAAAALVWEKTGALEVVRQTPRSSRGSKRPRVIHLSAESGSLG